MYRNSYYSIDKCKVVSCTFGSSHIIGGGLSSFSEKKGVSILNWGDMTLFSILY